MNTFAKHTRNDSCSLGRIVVCVVVCLVPRQAYGALGMARSEFVADSASCQFFWLLFDSDLTPAGTVTDASAAPLRAPMTNIVGYRV